MKTKHHKRLAVPMIIMAVWVLYTPTQAYSLAQASEYDSVVVFQSTSVTPVHISDIYSINHDGSNLTRLTEIGNAYRPDWSPDGTQIAFSISYGDYEENSSISVLHLDTGDIVEIVSFQDLPQDNLDFLSVSQPKWSPDGRDMLFVVVYQSVNCDQARSSDLYIIELASGMISRLTEDCDWERDPAWSPGGERILFLSDQDNDQEFYEYAIHTIDIDGDNRQRIPNDFPSDPVSPQWVDDDRILFANAVMEWGFFVFDTTTMETNLFTDFFPDFERVRSFDLSPDMQRMVFSACDGNQCQEDLYVLELETGEVTQLTENDMFDISPVWQPLIIQEE